MASNPVYSFFSTRPSLAPLILRAALCPIFFFHGMQKAFGWFGGEGWVATLAAWHGAADLSGTLVGAFIVAELAIALSLFLGLFTRLAGLGVAVLMAVTLMVLKETASFDAVEYPMMLIASGLALAFLGGGVFSADRALSRGLLPDVG